MLSPQLSKKIIQEVRRLLDEDIIVVNTNGIIMASTDKSRIGTFHEGAKIVSQQNAKLIITDEDQNRLIGVKAGINLPVLFKGCVEGVIGITGKPEKVSPYGELLKKMTELLIQESYFTDHMEWESRIIESFILDWIQLREWDTPFTNRAKVLNVDLRHDRIIAIGNIENEEIIERQIWQTVMNWNAEYEGDVIVRWGNNRILYLLAAHDHDSKSLIYNKMNVFKNTLKDQFSISLAIGIGQRAPASMIKKSYTQAERALKAAMPNQEIVHDEDLILEMLLEDISTPIKEDFIDRTIHSLLSQEELLDTLRTYLDNDLSMKKTAEQMHIHINTLHYRFKKIEDLSLLNPRKTAELVSLFFALHFLDETTKKRLF